MVSLFSPNRKPISSKPWRPPIPRVNLASPAPRVRLVRRDQISRHSKQLQPPQERQHNTTVSSPQQMAGNVCRFFSKVKELIIWSWSYLWALWFLLVLSVVYYLRGPLKITDNIGMGEWGCVSQTRAVTYLFLLLLLLLNLVIYVHSLGGSSLLPTGSSPPVS